MKFVINREKSNLRHQHFTSHLETDAGFVLAKSTRPFETIEKCAKEIADIKKDAAVTKIIQK